MPAGQSEAGGRNFARSCRNFGSCPQGGRTAPSERKIGWGASEDARDSRGRQVLFFELGKGI